MPEQITKIEERDGTKVEVVYDLVESEIKTLSRRDELWNLLSSVPVEYRMEAVDTILDSERELA